MENVPFPFRTPTRCPKTCCEAFPGIETCGWLMLSTTATTCSRSAGTNVRLGSGWNTRSPPRSARVDDELLGAVVHLGGVPGGLDERHVDHDVVAADVPLPHDDPELDVLAEREALAAEPLRGRERDLVPAGAEVLRDLHDRG